MQSICDQTVVMQKLRNTFVSDKVALSRQGLLAFVTKELLFVFVFAVGLILLYYHVDLDVR